MSSGGNEALALVYLVLVLGIVASSLFVRRMPIGQTAKMVGAWILIFAAFFLVVTVWDDLAALGKRAWGELRGETRVVQTGEELRIHKAADGHFWVDVRVNDSPMRLMIDSGATTSSFSTEAARKAAVEPTGQIIIVETFNGTVPATVGRARIRVGPIERELSVAYADNFGETGVLGMNFLSSLSSWGVEGQWLVLKP
ncbi:MAG TPA: TIGR02281 family clan AA aspartic protease [Allosphingosinicella sp.]|nr:TIGR02281 family clan AA aspartic protease [Allosphingosinicella sp.]